ncbi:Peptidyl-prolyl cis-trans isomerase CYP19-4 [Diplonema papillatum]|nr:Peptidyl-prolyl cis-trans isomerase CYP19-4 [Diplonema papillatum]
MSPNAAKKNMRLVGLMNTAQYRKCWEAGCYLAEKLRDEYSFTEVKMVPTDYEKWRAAMLETNAADLPKDVLSNAPAIIMCAGDDGSDVYWQPDDFIRFATKAAGFKVFSIPDEASDSYASAATTAYNEYLRSTGDSFAWLDISVEADSAVVSKRVTVQLFSQTCPKTVENFRHLCMGDVPNMPDPSGKIVKPHYKGTTVFRIVPNGWIQGGDVSNPGTMKAGSGGVSVFGDTFPDECFAVPHLDEGVLGMANNGPHTNASQFYITVARCQWMDKRYVGFGKVIDGMDHIRYIHSLPVKPNQAPTVPITITDCGVLEV